nr:EOG090X0C0Q [Megafenestra aurita]
MSVSISEENVWHICKYFKEKEPTLLSECYAVFISNEKQSIPLWNQRASTDEQDGLVIWDYHVIFIHKAKDGPLVYDLDSKTVFPCNFEDYQNKVLHSEDKILSQFHRLFRVIEAENFLDSFASDRTHMIKDGKWIKPPPIYQPICTLTSTNNLHYFIDMKSKDVPGQVLNYNDFVSQFS